MLPVHIVQRAVKQFADDDDGIFISFFDDNKPPTHTTHTKNIPRSPREGQSLPNDLEKRGDQARGRPAAFSKSKDNLDSKYCLQPKQRRWQCCGQSKCYASIQNLGVLGGSHDCMRFGMEEPHCRGCTFDVLSRFSKSLNTHRKLLWRLRADCRPMKIHCTQK